MRIHLVRVAAGVAGIQRVARIRQQIHDHLLQLLTPTGDGRQIIRHIEMQQNLIVAEDGAHECQRGVEDITDARGTVKLPILTGKGEQGTHNVRHALRLHDNLRRILAQRIVLIHAVHDELRVIHDAIQRIVNLVRHPAGQRTDSLQLLLLA